jgi:hypothetical protein
VVTRGNFAAIGPFLCNTAPCIGTSSRVYRACALLGSLECVHGSVDKGISLLEQAASKVRYCICVVHKHQCDLIDRVFVTLTLSLGCIFMPRTQEDKVEEVLPMQSKLVWIYKPFVHLLLSYYIAYSVHAMVQKRRCSGQLPRFLLLRSASTKPP